MMQYTSSNITNDFLYLFSNIQDPKWNWEQTNKMYSEKCLNVLKLFDLVLSLPDSSTECERGFSQVN